MKIIITESQLTNKVHHMVKYDGWKEVCDTLGLCPEELAKIFFKGDPNEFLNLYVDLQEHYDNNDVSFWNKGVNIESSPFTNYEDCVFYYYSDEPEWEGFTFNYKFIYGFLIEGFELADTEAIKMLGKWIRDNYELNEFKYDTTNIYFNRYGI